LALTSLSASLVGLRWLLLLLPGTPCSLPGRAVAYRTVKALGIVVIDKRGPA
jgi:hypothetical protein